MNPVLVKMAATFAALSLASIGGANAVLPELHRQVVDVLGWMDDTTFANLFALSQAAPGPNILLVSLIGWQTAGISGLLVATAAIMLPSSVLALIAGRVVTRWSDTPPIRVLKAGLVPVAVAVGLILASGVVMAEVADTHLLDYLSSAATAAVVVFSRRNPLWAFAAAAILQVATSVL